jgi:NAD(P)-dependent dehydrogenase (short-subunit alcohol dehydrogenase family)
MNGRRALVTGALRGIGLASAEALLADGCRVLGVDVREGQPGDFPMLVADLGRPEECRRVVEEAGRIDILVNNAAVLNEKPLAAIDPGDIERIMAVNFVAPFILSQLLGQKMTERGWGRIINIASIGARTGGNIMSAPYASSKAALVALTKNLARNYGPSGVTVNAIAPGAIDTPMARGQLGSSNPTLENLVALIPLGRLGSPAEVAAVVSFLASERSSFVTGATIDVNGGWLTP